MLGVGGAQCIYVRNSTVHCLKSQGIILVIQVLLSGLMLLLGQVSSFRCMLLSVSPCNCFCVEQLLTFTKEHVNIWTPPFCCRLSSLEQAVILFELVNLTLSTVNERKQAGWVTTKHISVMKRTFELNCWALIHASIATVPCGMFLVVLMSVQTCFWMCKIIKGENCSWITHELYVIQVP